MDFVKRSILDMKELRQSEDAFVDKLFADVPVCSAALLIATHARAYLDLNRAENELDPDMFAPPLDTCSLDVSYRVQAGLGVVPEYVAQDTPIYKERLPAREAEKRLVSVHRPYHQKLKSLLEKCRQEFGVAFLIDCHSMPSEPPINPKVSKPPTIILGDCWGSACMRDLTDITETLFLKAGFNVRRNVPYSGGYSTSSYGAPNSGIHALQIEISRALYMDEETLTPLPEFDAVKEAIGHISQELVAKIMERIHDHKPASQAAE
tara:strand:+ start:1582 stop:2373 length:792 start_codon:yes stop_codon:yes gene_type:complete